VGSNFVLSQSTRLTDGHRQTAKHDGFSWLYLSRDVIDSALAGPLQDSDAAAADAVEH